MVTLDASLTGATVSVVDAVLPPCGPTRASAFALSSGDIASLFACDAVGALLAPLSAFILFAISTPPAMAAMIRASAAHLIHDLLLCAGSCGKLGEWAGAGDVSCAMTPDVSGDGAGKPFASFCGVSVREMGEADNPCTADVAIAGLGGKAYAGATVELVLNTAPHRGQKRAWGLQIAWHWPQTFSRGSVGAADEFCLAPQLLQNLALGVSALLHSEQFIVCNR